VHLLAWPARRADHDQTVGKMAVKQPVATSLEPQRALLARHRLDPNRRRIRGWRRWRRRRTETREGEDSGG
jgi:hypothetical protein